MYVHLYIFQGMLQGQLHVAKWNVSQGQKEAIIIGLHGFAAWFCSMSVPMMEVIVEQIRDKDQISCFWHWSLGKTMFNVEQ